MPIRVEDVVHLEELRSTLATSLDNIKLVFGELSYGLLKVIDAHNILETKLAATEGRLATTEARLATTEARLDGEIAIIKKALHLN